MTTVIRNVQTHGICKSTRSDSSLCLMKTRAPTHNKCHLLVHRESKLNWFSYKVQFAFVKWVEVVKWEEGQLLEFFILQTLLSTRELKPVISPSASKVWMRCTSNADPVCNTEAEGQVSLSEPVTKPARFSDKQGHFSSSSFTVLSLAHATSDFLG